MENLEKLKQEVKKTLIEEIGEEGYYKQISESLEKLVPIKQGLDVLFQNVSVEEKARLFKEAVMSELVFDRYPDENDQIFYFGYYELVLDVCEF